MSMIRRPREPRTKHQPLGLYNLMNTCFANSVLQQLFTLPKTRASVLDQDMDKIRSKMEEKQSEVKIANEELRVSTKIEKSEDELKRTKSRLEKLRREAQDSAREWAVRRQIQWTFAALQNQWCGPAVIPNLSSSFFLWFYFLLRVALQTVMGDRFPVRSEVQQEACSERGFRGAFCAAAALQLNASLFRLSLPNL